MTWTDPAQVERLIREAEEYDADFERLHHAHTLAGALAAELVAVRAELAAVRPFVAEMSGLISDMGDVPDPGMDDLHGMVGVIRAWFDRERAAREAAERERDELKIEWNNLQINASIQYERAEATEAEAECAAAATEEGT